VTTSVRASTASLVRLHDGMSPSWWWVRAVSPQRIVDACAQVDVVTGADTVGRAEDWSLEELDLDDLPTGHPLDKLRAERERRRRHPQLGCWSARSASSCGFRRRTRTTRCSWTSSMVRAGSFARSSRRPRAGRHGGPVGQRGLRARRRVIDGRGRTGRETPACMLVGG
jgi:hypothetical protein